MKVTKSINHHHSHSHTSSNVTTPTQAVKNLNPLICRFYFLDGKAKAMGVNPSATAADVIRALADKIELQNVDGWALYEVSMPEDTKKSFILILNFTTTFL